MKKYALFVVAALTSVLSVFGLASSAGAGTTPTPAPVTACVCTPPPGPVVRGFERFQILSTSPDAQPVVIANGLIHARGRDVQINDNLDKFVFPNGWLLVSHHTLAGTAHNRFDAVTCLDTYTERGTYRIIAGYGADRGITGYGTYHLEVDTVGADRNHPDLFIEHIGASGPIERHVLAH
jgi:hypothetical protein